MAFLVFIGFEPLKQFLVLDIQPISTVEGIFVTIDPCPRELSYYY